MSSAGEARQPRTRPSGAPRWLLFAVAMGSLVLLTYAGVLLAFSIEVTDEMAAANPQLRAGQRAIVVPVADPGAVPTRAENETPALLVHANSSGAFPTSATSPRAGQALAYVAAGANATLELDNATIDLAAISGGAEGWLLKGEAEEEAWFSPRAATLGEVARVESPATIGLMFGLGTIGFVAPLIGVILTHRGTRGEHKGAPDIVCRECRAPMPPKSEFCMRCGAWSAGET